MLSASLLKLAAAAGGQWTDALETLLTDSKFVDLNCEAGMQEDYAAQVAAAMSCISRLTYADVC